MPAVLLRVSARAIVLTALLVSLVAIGAGFILDARGFAGNLLAEIAGILISVLLAIFVIDVLLDRARARRWKLVSNETLVTLQFAVIRAGLEIYLLLPAPRPPRADPYTSSMSTHGSIPESLRVLARAIRETEVELDPGIATRLRPHFEVLRDGVMPRLLTIGEHDLIARLAALEGTAQDLEHIVWQDTRFGYSDALPKAIQAVAEALADIAGAVDDDLTANPVAGRAARKAADPPHASATNHRRTEGPSR
jgi:hypothetical protein